MRRVTSQNFSGGMEGDTFARHVPGKLSKSRNFDLLTFPNRLFPLPSMAADTAGTAIGNVITASDGIAYGLGENGASAGKGTIFKSTGSGWTEITNARSGQNLDYSMLSEYKANGTRSLLYSASGNITEADPAGGVSIAEHSLSHTYMSNGFVHPTNDIWYVGYKTSSATYILSNNANTYNDTALALPAKYTPVRIDRFGNYLAIFCTTFSSGAVPGGSPDVSGIFLWNMDETQSWQEFIPLGNMSLFAGGNLEGILVAVGTVQENDSGSLIAKGYDGGTPRILDEIPVMRKDAATSPSFTSYPRVNIVRRNRLHFSIDLVGGGTSSPSHKGLWSIGKNSLGRWVMFVERYASTDGSDVSLIAATFILERLFAVHTAVGTLTKGVQSSSGWATEYASEAVWKSEINPDMPDADKPYKKQLMAAGLLYDPLPSGAQAVMQYRVDGGSWIDVLTETTAAATITERTRAASEQFTSGRNYEFRIKSTGFAQPVAYFYKYAVLRTAI